MANYYEQVFSEEKCCPSARSWYVREGMRLQVRSGLHTVGR